MCRFTNLSSQWGHSNPGQRATRSKKRPPQQRSKLRLHRIQQKVRHRQRQRLLQRRPTILHHRRHPSKQKSTRPSRRPSRQNTIHTKRCTPISLRRNRGLRIFQQPQLLQSHPNKKCPYLRKRPPQQLQNLSTRSKGSRSQKRGYNPHRRHRPFCPQSSMSYKGDHYHLQRTPPIHNR